MEGNIKSIFIRIIEVFETGVVLGNFVAEVFMIKRSLSLCFTKDNDNINKIKDIITSEICLL